MELAAITGNRFNAMCRDLLAATTFAEIMRISAKDGAAAQTAARESSEVAMHVARLRPPKEEVEPPAKQTKTQLQTAPSRHLGLVQPSPRKQVTANSLFGGLIS